MGKIEKQGETTYSGTLNYEGAERTDSLVLLGLYLKGKPDTEGWRKTFTENNMTPIEFKGRIFPTWAVLDFYKLCAEDPAIEEIVIRKNNLTRDDIPSKEEAERIK